MTPEPLPEPPTNSGDLAARFPVFPKSRIPQYAYRVHRVDREPEWFGSSGDFRWDPPTPDTAFGTCYVAANRTVAFVEVFGDFDLLTQDLVEARCIATVQLRENLKLADMSSRRILGEWQLDRRISVGDDYGVCQRWANALHLAGFSGVAYSPRHDAGPGYDDLSIALFGDAGYQPTQLQVVLDAEPISPELLRHVQAEFGIRILPPALI